MQEGKSEKIGRSIYPIHPHPSLRLLTFLLEIYLLFYVQVRATYMYKEEHLDKEFKWGGGAGYIIALVFMFLSNIPAVVFGFLLHMNLLVDYQSL